MDALEDYFLKAASRLKSLQFNVGDTVRVDVRIKDGDRSAFRP